MPGIQCATSILVAICLATSVLAAPAGTSSALESTATAPYASENSNNILWTETQNTTPEPIRGNFGATVLGPQNVAVDLQNADLLAPPTTDAGTVYVSSFSLWCSLVSSACSFSGNAKWPFGLSHNRLQTGGWARQQNGRCLLRYTFRSYVSDTILLQSQ